MKCCVLTSWKSTVVHERPLVAMEVHGRFRLGSLVLLLLILLLMYIIEKCNLLVGHLENQNKF